VRNEGGEGKIKQTTREERRSIKKGRSLRRRGPGFGLGRSTPVKGVCEAQRQSKSGETRIADLKDAKKELTKKRKSHSKDEIIERSRPLGK